MLFNLIVAAIVLLVAYMWTAQGFFSAMIHLLCTLAAGAIAFAVWEPLVYMLLLDSAPSIAWTVGLVVPFIVALVILRIATDKLITRDIKMPGALDFVGGGVAGAGAGVIATGVLVIGIGFMPLGSSFLGHRKMDYSAGNLVHTNALWVPVDTLTANLYESLSTAAFSAGDSALALRMPSVDDQASLVRATYDDRASTTIKPDAFELIGSYIVEATSIDELTADGFNGPDKPQQILNPSGEPAAPNSVIRGYTITFQSDAAEKSGQIIFGPGQLRLVCKLADGSSQGFQPVAVVAQTSGREISASRYRYDVKGVFIGNASSARSPTMSFEFIVPADAEPIDLLVRQTRVTLDSAPAPRTYTVDERDDAVFSLELIARSDEAPTGERPSPQALAATTGSENSAPLDGSQANREGIRITRDLSGLSLSRQNRGSLSLNDDNYILSGTHTFGGDDVSNSKVPSSLKVKGFSVRPGVSLVQVDVSINKRASLLGKAISAAEQLLAPVLVDANGEVYQAVGYIFNAGDRVEIRYEPGDPIRAMSQLPALSTSRPTDKLTLLFHVAMGVEVESFSLGQQVEVLTFDPPLIPTR